MGELQKATLSVSSALTCSAGQVWCVTLWARCWRITPLVLLVRKDISPAQAVEICAADLQVLASNLSII